MAPAMERTAFEALASAESTTGGYKVDLRKLKGERGTQVP